MNHNTYKSKICEDCGYTMLHAEARRRLCGSCVRERFIQRSQSETARAKMRALQTERETAKLTAFVDAELADPTRYWESP